MPWIEEASGIDITPCDDADGSWNPSADCGGSFSSGEQMFGSWGDWCSGTPESGLLSDCGPAYGEPFEDNPPQISWANPTGDITLADGETIELQIDASDDAYVNGVALFINGEEMAYDSSDP